MKEKALKQQLKVLESGPKVKPTAMKSVEFFAPMDVEDDGKDITDTYMNDPLYLSLLHNLGGKDRPPMLAPGNYVQWKSRIKRYINTKPNNELIHYCLQNPPYKFKWTEKTVPVAKGVDNDIYSTIDACPNACEMWKAIERLK
ncbi:hypothetical protein Tco_1059752 [Tanacetum coccineum]